MKVGELCRPGEGTLQFKGWDIRASATQSDDAEFDTKRNRLLEMKIDNC